VGEEYGKAWDLIVKSFAPVAVFDKHYDELGAFPEPPALDAGQPAARTLIVYNDTFQGEDVTVRWEAVLDGRRIAGESRDLRIPLGDHIEFGIEFTPARAGNLQLRVSSEKGGEVQFEDMRPFTVR
jgi:hypothetical protein